MVFFAGQRVSAADLNALFPIFGRMTADVTRNNSTTLVNATGLSLALEANSVYALDGLLFYSSNGTADLKIALTVPSGTTGKWGVTGLGTGASSPGVVDAAYLSAFGTGTTFAVGGDTAFPTLMARPGAVLITAGTAGSVQLMFAQNTANASNTVMQTGSWLRAMKIA